MAFIPRRNYAQAHLDEIRFLTGVDDWFSFLDRPDRLPYLMEISEPWHESLSIRYMLDPGHHGMERLMPISWHSFLRPLDRANRPRKVDLENRFKNDVGMARVRRLLLS